MCLGGLHWNNKQEMNENLSWICVRVHMHSNTHTNCVAVAWREGEVGKVTISLVDLKCPLNTKVHIFSSD